MTKTHALSLTVLLLLGAAAFAGPASALTLSLDVVFAGPSLMNPPFATLDINPIAGGMQFILHNVTPGALPGDTSKLDGVYFNYKGSEALIVQPPPSGTALEFGQDAFKADGSGWYDVRLSYEANGYLGSFDSVVFNILGDTNPQNFVDLAVPGGGNGVYYAAAHLQSAAPGGTWIGVSEATPTEPVPEPATLLLFGAGTVALGALKRRKV